MTDLDAIESDADGMFWYDPVGKPVQCCPADPAPVNQSPDKKHWVEIVLYDEQKMPIPGHAYRIQLPNGSVVTGNLDSRGRARINGIDPGTCQVSFPDMDRVCWDRL